MARYKTQEDVFEKFFANRDYLIIKFSNGDITKREFIEEHFYFIQSLNLKPFINGIDSFEKGIYNYQYYNMLAKYYYMKARDKKIIEKHPEEARSFLEKGKYYYHLKDKSTLKLLQYINFQNVEAYFIKVNSKKLKDQLFEIVLKDYNDTILHSKSKYILNILKNEGVFKQGVRKSLIDSYINQRY